MRGQLKFLLRGALCATLANGSIASVDAADVRFDGAPSALIPQLKLVSQLDERERNFATIAAARRAARKEAPAIAKALQSAGYYAADVDFSVDATDGAPAIIYKIDAGPAFSISEYKVVYSDNANGRPLSLPDAKIAADGLADGASLQQRQTELLRYLRTNGFPSARIVSRRAIATIDEGMAVAEFVFESGPRTTFGTIETPEFGKINPDYLVRLKTWEDGAQFDQDKLLAYRDALGATGLFSSIDLELGDPNATGAAPIIITATERKRRTIGAGLSFSTAEGPGGRIFFENRNLFGRGENLRAEIAASEIEQAITVDLTRPLPALPGQIFGSFALINESTEAFDAQTINLTGGVSKFWLERRLETRAALTLETSRVDDGDSEEQTFFVAAPLSVIWNTEDNLLNPQRGVRATWTVLPYAGTDNFVQSEISARSRIKLSDRFTIAGRARLGATFGVSLDGLPQNKRFFAGGGASVRGFGFQEAGPLDVDLNPIGGRSIIEGAVEARALVTKSIQLAAFIDSGTVGASAFPDFGERFFTGVGGGVRYLTPIGPIRADVAFPLNARDTDRNFQLYIALGQSF